MSQVKTKKENQDLLQVIIEGMQDKKAQDISVLNLQKITSAMANYFIVCTGQSTTQIESIAENIIEVGQKKAGQKPWKKEGFNNKEWILLDYMDIVVHIFQSEKRNLYSLETLWKEAEITNL